MSDSYVGQKIIQMLDQQILVGDGGDSYPVSKDIEGASSALVFLGGVIQRPNIDFSISGGTLVFGENIPVGDQIIVHPFNKKDTIVTPLDESVTVAMLNSDIIATQEETDDKILRDVVVTPSTLGDFVFMRHALIDNVPVVVGGVGSYTNTLGKIPVFIRVVYRCTAPANGYVAGDQYDPLGWRYTAQSIGEIGLGFTLISDTTINTKYGASRAPYIPNKLTTATEVMTIANFVAEIHLFA